MRGGLGAPQQGPGGMYGSGGAMQAGPMPQGMPTQGGQMYAMGAGGPGGPPGGPPGPPGQGTMAQYGSYQPGPMPSGQMMAQGPGAGSGPPTTMISQGYQPAYQGNPAMMGLRQQQPGGPYITQGMTPQQQMVQRPQYIQVQYYDFLYLCVCVCFYLSLSVFVFILSLRFSLWVCVSLCHLW